MCRYVSRGPIALERLSIDGDGLAVHELKHPFRDGTTHVLFEPLDFAALAHPCARGISASCARHGPPRRFGAASDNQHEGAGQTHEPKPTAPMNWMQRLRRVFEIDLKGCPRCGGTVRVIAAITEPTLIAQILKHRASRDDFSAEVPVGVALAPPVATIH